MLLSEVLKQRRAELGYTLLDVANKMGVAEATVQRWESGVIKSIKYDKITKLADVLNVEPAALMGWEEEKPPEMDGKAQQLAQIINQLNDQNLDRAIDLLSVLLQTQ